MEDENLIEQLLYKYGHKTIAGKILYRVKLHIACMNYAYLTKDDYLVLYKYPDVKWLCGESSVDKWYKGELKED